MNKKILGTTIFFILASQSVFAKDLKKLTFYRNLAEYKENKVVKTDEDNSIKIDLIDTAVLDSFNVVMSQEGRELLPSSIEIHEKSEENILKLNQGKKVFVNNKEYILESNGNGFLKLKNKEGLITYIPKNKIEEINFINDISSVNHIAKINLREDIDSVRVDYHYMLGLMNWKPSYNFYIKDKDTVQLDYYIEVNNQTLNTFKDIKLEVVVDKNPELINTEYTSSDQGGVFDYYQKIELKSNADIYIGNKEQDGYATAGYNRSGYDSSGFSRDTYTEPEKRTEMGVSIFSLPKEITLSPKSKSKHLFIDTKEIEYEKINYLHEPNVSNYTEEDLKGKVFKTKSKLSFKNAEGIPYKRGIGSLYSKEKLDFDKILLKEYLIEEGEKNKVFELNIGNNADLYLDYDSQESIYSDIDVLIYNDKEGLKEKIETIKKGFELRESEFTTYANFYIEKIKLKINNKNEESLVLLNNYYGNSFVKSENIEKIKSLIKDFKTLPKEERTEEELDNLSSRINKFVEKGSLTFDLKNLEYIEYYKLREYDDSIDLNSFNKDYFEDNKEERMDIEDYLKKLD